MKVSKVIKKAWLYSIRRGELCVREGRIIITGCIAEFEYYAGNTYKTVIVNPEEGVEKTLMVWLYDRDDEKAIDVLIERKKIDLTFAEKDVTTQKQILSHLETLKVMRFSK